MIDGECCADPCHHSGKPQQVASKRILQTVPHAHLSCAQRKQAVFGPDQLTCRIPRSKEDSSQRDNSSHESHEKAGSNCAAKAGANHAITLVATVDSCAESSVEWDTTLDVSKMSDV